MIVKIEEVSSSLIRIEIPSEWGTLGRELVFRYAEGIAEAVTMGTKWRGTTMIQNDTDTLTVKLSRINR